MFFTPAYAQTADAAATAPSGIQALIQSPLPMFLIVIVIFYFLIIRPQQKQAAEQKAKLAAAQKGDTVLTAGGVYGKVISVDTDTVMVEIATGVKVKVLKSTLADIQPINPNKAAND